ncbi:MAG: AraC family transcriptional regulator, partial [Spirochaetales bacterium]|nr:AraC family transcriptional regulator [Spirochaetales bacterium]
TLSISIIIVQRVLKLEHFIFLCGVYFALLGFIALCFAVIYAYPQIPVYREIFLLARVIGLSCAYPVVMLVHEMNPALLGKQKVAYVYSFIICLQAVAVIDLIGGFDLLFRVNNSMVTVRPLFKIVYIPFSFIGLTALGILTYLTYRSINGKYKKLMRTFSYGIFCKLPFEYWDIYNWLVKENPNRDIVYLYNIGILLFAMFFSAMVIQFIQTKLKIDAIPLLKNMKDSAGKKEPEYLEQIYQKVVIKMTDNKLYADEHISIEKLAKRLHENRNEISKAVNRYYGDNFTNFINYFRVEELKRQLADPGQEASILELGLKAGFKSKTSINRIFFKFTKLTPRDYRNSILQKSTQDMTGKTAVPVQQSN